MPDMIPNSTANFADNTSDLANDVPPELAQRWNWAIIDGTRWCKKYPYQLVVLDATKSYSLHKGLVFTLPVNPESLTMSTPFAIQTAATLGDGVIEQHGGVPFRDISISGTFGILPSGTRSSSPQLVSTGVLGSLAGGTIAAAQGVANSFSILTGSSPYTQNIITSKESELSFGQSRDNNPTGYGQYLQLQCFLESYAEMKKTADGQKLRLALLIWKENAGYIVTPKVFRVTKSAQSPHEYKYDLQFQAWKRIDPTATGYNANAQSSSKIGFRSTNWVNGVFAKIQAARNVINGARATILAVKSDYDNTIGKAIREVSCLMKDVSGLAKTLADFPASIRDAVAQDIGTFIGSAGSMVNSISKTDFKGGFKDAFDSDKFNRIVQKTADKINPPDTNSALSLDGGSSASFAASKSTSSSDPQTSKMLDDIKNGGPKALTAAMVNPDNASLHDAISPTDYPMSSRTRNMISAHTDAVRKLTREDFKKMQKDVEAFAASFADSVGLGSEIFNKSKGFSTSAQIKEPTEEDHAVLAALSEVSSSFGKLAAFSQPVMARIPSSIEYVAAAFNQAGIDMRVPKSKFASPFPYGSSLEKMAAQYLGDSTRWNEIAGLNNLMEPYIDEAGTNLALLISGNGNDVVVADASGLVLGQTVTLFSNTQNEQTRVVLNTNKVAPGYWTVTLNGAADLDTLLASDNSFLKYFSANTIRGGQLLYIPSDSPAAITSPYVPSSSDLDRMLQIGDCDEGLNATGDLDIRADGDIPFVWGVQSIIQWTRIAVSTPQGSMPLHPEFGLPLVSGQSLADTSAKDILAGLQATFANGPSLTGIKSVQVDNSGPVSKVAFELEVKGASALIPVAFEIKR